MRYLNIRISGLMVWLSLFLIGLEMGKVQAQDDAQDPERIVSRRSELWTGLYTKYRIGEKLYYYGEYHLRTRDQLIQNMAQLYLRFGLSYIIDKQLEITAGVATPLYWAPPEFRTGDDPFDNVVAQYRLWQQLLFVQSIGTVKVFHQIRTEQRWRRDWIENSPFLLTYRWRYKLSAYIPINNTSLQKKTLFGSVNNEIFIQSGKTIIKNPFEENRAFLGLGYILNEKLQFQAGYTFSVQQRASGVNFNNRGLVRFAVYHNLDLTKKRKSKPQFQPMF